MKQDSQLVQGIDQSIVTLDDFGMLQFFPPALILFPVFVAFSCFSMLERISLQKLEELQGAASEGEQAMFDEMLVQTKFRPRGFDLWQLRRKLVLMAQRSADQASMKTLVERIV